MILNNSEKKNLFNNPYTLTKNQVLRNYKFIFAKENKKVYKGVFKSKESSNIKNIKLS